MENINVVNDTQKAVVVPEASVTEKKGAKITGTLVNEGKAELAARAQSARENSGFRKMRLENEKYKREIDELRSKLSGLSDISRLKEQNKRYLDELIKNKMESDLKSIQRLDPSVTDLESLGDEFLRLIENGIDASVAFSAVRKATEGKVTPKPPVTGAVGRSESPKNKFYTSKELDRLTAKDLENPAVFRKAMESLKML